MLWGAWARPNRIAAKVAFAILLVPLACSRQDTSPTDEAIGDYTNFPGGLAGQKIAYDQAETSMVSCMKLEGFDYRPVNPLRNGSIQMGPSVEDVGSLEFRKIHGLGIVDSLNEPVVAANPNAEYVATLNADDEAKFFALLGGSEQLQPTGFVSCRKKAYAAIDKWSKASSELSGSMTGLELRILNDKRMGSIRTRWKDCMHTKGFAFGSPQQMFQEMTESTNRAVEAGQLKKARFDEIAVSVADFVCVEKTRREAQQIRRSYEKAFIEKNRAALEEGRFK